MLVGGFLEEKGERGRILHVLADETAEFDFGCALGDPVGGQCDVMAYSADGILHGGRVGGVQFGSQRAVVAGVDAGVVAAQVQGDGACYHYIYRWCGFLGRDGFRGGFGRNPVHLFIFVRGARYWKGAEACMLEKTSSRAERRRLLLGFPSRSVLRQKPA